MLDDFADGLHRVFDAGRVDLEVLDGPADLVDVFARFVEDVINLLSEADDRVVERASRLLVGLDVDLELTRNSIEFLKDRLLVVLHAGRFVEEPDDSQLVFFEVAEDLACELVESDADLFDVEERVAGDLAAAAQISGGADGSRFKGDRPKPSILTPGRLVPSLIRPLPVPRTLGVVDPTPVPFVSMAIEPSPLSPSPASVIAGSPGVAAFSSPIA